MSSGRAFLTAEWRNLALLNYAIDAAVLAPLVPAGCELDSFDGRTLVSMVGFQFLRTRVLGIPVPFHRNFEEVNLRFYVRRRAMEGWRRGVVFVKELVPRAAIALVARQVYGENYQALPMRHRVQAAGAAGRGSVSYEWRRGESWEGLTADFSGAPALPPEDSEEAFLTEHYWGYCRQPRGPSVEYQVEHPRWRVWRAGAAALRCNVSTLYGPAFAEALTAPPGSAFLAEGSPVVVRRGRRLE